METTTHHILSVTSSSGPLRTTTRQFHHSRDHYLHLTDSSIIMSITIHLYLEVPSSWWPLHTSTSLGPLPTCTWHFPSFWASPPTSIGQFRYPGDDYALQPDSSIILVTTTHLYLTGGHCTYLPDCSVILGNTPHLWLTIPSSSWPLPTSTWQVHHPVNHHALLIDNSIILGTKTQFYLTVPSSRGPQRTSTWPFHHHGDHDAFLHDSSVIVGTASHFYLRISSSWRQLHTSSWRFHHPVDNYPPQQDSSITTAHVILTVPASWWSLSMPTGQNCHPTVEDIP